MLQMQIGLLPLITKLDRRVGDRRVIVVLCTGDAAARYWPISFSCVCGGQCTAINRLPEPRSSFNKTYRVQVRLVQNWGSPPYIPIV